MDALLRRRMMMASSSSPSPSRLPQGYTEVEYIQNTTDAYIDTGIAPSCTWTFKAMASSTPSSIGIIIGTKTSTGHWIGALTNGYWGTGNSSGNYISGYTNISESQLSVVVNEKSIVYSVGSSSSKTKSADAAINTSVWLFSASPSSSTYYPFLGRIIGDVVATRSGNEIFHGVCCISPNNEVGLYDLISRTFLGSASSGTFTAGPTI